MIQYLHLLFTIRSMCNFTEAYSTINDDVVLMTELKVPVPSISLLKYFSSTKLDRKNKIPKISKNEDNKRNKRIVKKCQQRLG